MKNKISFALILLAGCPLLFTGCATAPNPAATAPKLAALKLYWDGRDNYTTATAAGEAEAKAAGYQFIRNEGYVFKDRQTNTVPLTQYWSVKRHDHLLLARALARTLAKNAVYEPVRIEGYAYARPQPGTVPLKRFGLAHKDNFTLATAQGEKDALSAGYVLNGIEAYVPDQPTFIPRAATNGPAHFEEVVLTGDGKFNTTKRYRPPVDITIVAKTDSTDLRMGYAADQVIFNWQLNPDQLRVDGGPASGLHRSGAGHIPVDKFVTIHWLVTPQHQAIFVDNQLRFEHSGDYAHINRPVTVFPAEGSKVTIQSVVVKQLSRLPVAKAEAKTRPSPPPPLSPSPVAVEAVSTAQLQDWIAQLADPDFSRRKTAIHALAQHSAAALPLLKQALKAETDEDRRWWIQSAIQESEQKE